VASTILGAAKELPVIGNIFGMLNDGIVALNEQFKKKTYNERVSSINKIL